jgi:hypothetical protein
MQLVYKSAYQDKIQQLTENKPTSNGGMRSLQPLLSICTVTKQGYIRHELKTGDHQRIARTVYPTAGYK